MTPATNLGEGAALALLGAVLCVGLLPATTVGVKPSAVLSYSVVPNVPAVVPADKALSNSTSVPTGGIP